MIFNLVGKKLWCRGLLGGSAPPGPPVSAQHWVEFLKHFLIFCKTKSARHGKFGGIEAAELLKRLCRLNSAICNESRLAARWFAHSCRAAQHNYNILKNQRNMKLQRRRDFAACSTKPLHKQHLAAPTYRAFSRRSLRGVVLTDVAKNTTTPSSTKRASHAFAWVRRGNFLATVVSTTLDFVL